MASTRSPMDTPLWEALGRAVKKECPQAELSPLLMLGLSDMRWFRQRGIPAYGVGLFSPDLPVEDLASRVHGHDERIDLESLRLSTRLWLNLVDQMHEGIGDAQPPRVSRDGTTAVTDLTLTQRGTDVPTDTASA